jgi:hypothetical protein
MISSNQNPVSGTTPLHPPNELVETVQEIRISTPFPLISTTPRLTPADTATADALMEEYLKDTDIRLFYTDGSYFPPTHPLPDEFAGWAWAQFRNSQGNGTVFTQDIITENYGSMQNLLLRDPVTQAAEEIAMNSLHAELTAMGMALYYIKSDPLLINTKIVICYGSQVAKGLITGDNKSHNSYSTNLVTAGRRALKETNNLRATAAKSRMPAGLSPQSIVEANHIQFRWIKAHSGRDVGKAWVDAPAKAGAYGHTPDTPMIGQESAPVLSELDLATLQLFLTNHPKEVPNQIATTTDYLETDDPDIAIFDYYDDRPQDLL